MRDVRKLKKEEGQKLMEEHLERTLHENNIDQKDRLNGMMRSSGGDCSFEDMSLTFYFPLQQWQANRVGNLHGGVICTAFDITIAALARFIAGENFAPTVDLNVRYIRPAKVDEEIQVTAKATAAGRRIIQLTAEAKSCSSEKLIATATSMYLNADTQREHETSR